VDLRRIRQFVVLSEVLNYRKAAERLHIAQPALTVSIQKLEAELGAILFDRSSTGVTLTAAGTAALPAARRTLQHGEQFMESARAVGSGEGGLIRIGFVGSSTIRVLPTLVQYFRSRYPKVELVLRQATSSQIAQMLDEEALDVGLVRTPVVTSSKVALMLLEHEEFVVVLPADHAAAAQPLVHMHDLADEPFLMYTADTSPGLRAAAMMVCESAGFVPRVAQEVTQVHVMVAMVESGLGIALVPAVMERFASDTVVMRRLARSAGTLPIDLTLALAFRPDGESATAQRFRAAAQALFDVGLPAIQDGAPA